MVSPVLNGVIPNSGKMFASGFPCKLFVVLRVCRLFYLIEGFDFPVAASTLMLMDEGPGSHPKIGVRCAWYKSPSGIVFLSLVFILSAPSNGLVGLILVADMIKHIINKVSVVDTIVVQQDSVVSLDFYNVKIVPTSVDPRITTIVLVVTNQRQETIVGLVHIKLGQIVYHLLVTLELISFLAVIDFVHDQ